jgi:FKBP-type peptidyl-prolyl cis-trans isomerase 2
MKHVTKGSTVALEFTGTLDDGTVFEKATGDHSIEFTVGAHEVIPGLEEAVIGMVPGESKTTVIPYQQAFGPYQKERLVRVNRNKLPRSVKPEVGSRVNLSASEGGKVPATVVEANESEIVCDANDPLAGQNLTFDLKVLAVQSSEDLGLKPRAAGGNSAQD